MDIEDYRTANPKVHEVPFNSSNKWQMSIHSMQYMGGKQLLLLKVILNFIIFKYYGTAIVIISNIIFYYI